MSDESKSGCLGVLLAALGIHPKNATSEPTMLPYGLRDAFLSPAEISFYLVLSSQLAPEHILQTKVRLADVFFVRRPHENKGAFNRIAMKHVDFLLCSSKTMQPLLGIELDDASHKSVSRQSRDEFVDQVFETAELPLLRIPVAHTYSTGELVNKIREAVNCRDTVMPPPLLG